MDWPSLSVIIPSYNQGPYIERTLLSILKQDYPGELQVVVSDGGSTDETLAVLKKYPQVQWWSERDGGFVDAVTKGLAAAVGEIVAIQSSDDYYLEGAFIKAVTVLRENNELAFVTGNDVIIDEEGQVHYPQSKPYITMLSPGALLSRTPTLYVPQHCTFARRSALDRIGGLRQEVDYCADFDLWYRLLHFGRAVMLPDYLAAYQKHPAQRTQNKADHWIMVLKKVVEDAEENSLYAAQFRPTPEMKRNIFLQWEVFWNTLAGGEEGQRRAHVLAEEALRHPDLWPEYVLEYIKMYGATRPFWVKQKIQKTLLRLKRNPTVRSMFGQAPLPRYGTGPDRVQINLDWWQDACPTDGGKAC